MHTIIPCRETKSIVKYSSVTDIEETQLTSLLPSHFHALSGHNAMAAGSKASRLLACALVAALYAVTLAGCAVGLAGHEPPAEREAVAPESVQQSTQREAKATVSAKPRTRTSRGQHRKATTEGRSLASKTAVPLPDSDLLVPPPEPNCKLDAPDLKADDAQRLDYERQCYRAAEVFARGRLLLLQTSVDKTVEALRNREQTNP